MYQEEIKAAIVKYGKKSYFGEKAYQMKADLYPDGALSFWKEKRYECLKEIEKNSLYGSLVWVELGCPDLMSYLPTDVINSIDCFLMDLTGRCFKEMSQDEKAKYLKDDLDSFFRLWFEYRTIDKKIRDLEQNRGKSSKPKKIEFKDIFKDGAYKKTMEWLRENNKLNEAGIFLMEQSEFVEFVYALHYKNYLEKKPKASEIIQLMKHSGLSPLSSQQINNIKRKYGNTDFNSKRSGTTFYNVPPFS